jgi:AcrR family transcriptional regulator
MAEDDKVSNVIALGVPDKARARTRNRRGKTAAAGKGGIAAGNETATKPKRSRGRPRQGSAIARDLPRDAELLKIAASVLYKKGVEGAKLDDIAEEAGIVKGSLYHYFRSKEDIYRRLVENVRSRIDIDQEVNTKASAMDRLDRLVRARLSTTVEYPLEVGLLVRELVRLDGPAGDWAREDPKRYFVAIRRLLIEGQKEGVFRAADPDILAAVIVGIFAHLPTWYRLGGRIRPGALVDEASEFLLAGLRSRSARVKS